MKLLDRITVEPGKCGGRPCIRGQRMRVTDILDLLSHGASHEEILADYSFLEPDDILAAIASPFNAKARRRKVNLALGSPRRQMMSVVHGINLPPTLAPLQCKFKKLFI